VATGKPVFADLRVSAAAAAAGSGRSGMSFVAGASSALRQRRSAPQRARPRAWHGNRSFVPRRNNNDRCTR
jgi:hypothetical protein